MLFIFYTLVLTSFIQIECKKKKEQSSESEDRDLGNNLADILRNDANLDLPVDEEYEDLRAEFLAYRSALASLASSDSPDFDDADTPEAKRRSMLSTPCWQRSGICINHRLCKGFPSLSEIPGCKDKLRVCCFVWAKYNVRDHKEHGLGNLQLPWSLHAPFGGKGVVLKNITKSKRPRNRDKKNKKKPNRPQPLGFIIRT